MRSRLTRVAAIAVLAMAAAACSKTLNTDQLQTTLASQLDTQLNTTGSTVSCPNDVKVETGGTFDCTATLSDGTSLTLTVKQLDDAGHVHWSVASPAPSTSSS